MSKKSLYLLGIFLTILIGTFLNWKYCCNCSDKGTTLNNALVVNPIVKNGLKLSSDGFQISEAENYNFAMSNQNFVLPLASQINNVAARLKEFMDQNGDQQLTIIGHYKSNEINNTAFPDLGIARANAVKNHLVSQGLISKNIFTKSKLDDSFTAYNDTLYGPISLELNKFLPEKAIDWNALGEKIKANPLVLYFETGAANVNLTQEQKQQFADISNYLDHVEGSKSIITGHTDNEGDKAANIQLGKGRADFAKTYLMTNGINGDKIETTSLGSNQPIADNKTEEGRAQNRRTIVTIQ